MNVNETAIYYMIYNTTHYDLYSLVLSVLKSLQTHFHSHSQKINHFFLPIN